MMRGKTIAVWFSCGAASAVAAKKTIELYGKQNTVLIFNNPIKEEHEDNRRFLLDCEKWFGQKVTVLTHPIYPDQSAQDVWEDRRFMSGPKGAPCTSILKQEVRRRWEMENSWDHRVLGFTLDETPRYKRFISNNQGDTLPVLIDLKLSKQDCFNILNTEGVRLPEIYALGYPNANCIGCVKATTATYWNHVRLMHPHVFKERAELSRELGAKLVRCHPKHLWWCSKHADGLWYDDRQGKCLHVEDKKTGKMKLESPRIYLDELPEHVRGRSMKTMNIECGAFCQGVQDDDSFLD